MTMKKLNQLLERISYTCIQGSIDTEVTDIVNDSRKITPGCLFFCIPGAGFSCIFLFFPL